MIPSKEALSGNIPKIKKYMEGILIYKSITTFENHAVNNHEEFDSSVTIHSLQEL